MISSKKRRQGSGTVSHSEGYSRTLPRPSDIARNLATPTYPSSSSSSSSTALHLQQATPFSSSPATTSNNRQTPVSLSMPSYFVGKSMRAVANPYDDLSLYTSQINAVHKPEIRSVEPNQGGYRGRVSATSASSNDTRGYFGFDKPATSNDTRGYFGFNKPSKNNSIPSRQYGYNKPTDIEPKGYYGFNKPSVSDSVFSGRYGYDQAHAESRSSKTSRPKTPAEQGSVGPQHAPSSTSYSMTLPWSGRYGKQGQDIEPNIEHVYTHDHPSASTNSLAHGFIYEGHTRHCPEENISIQTGPSDLYNTSGYPVHPMSVGPSSANHHLQQFVTSTPKHRRDAPPPPEFDDHNLTASMSSSFSSPSSSSIDYTATLPAKLSRASRSPQAPPHLHIRCDLASRFATDETADQQRSQSMSPRVYRSSQATPGYQTTDLFVRESKTPPASNSLAYDDPAFNTLMEDMYNAQRQLQNGSRVKQKPKNPQDSGNQGAISAPPKQAGLAATLNYHQQLRKELGMPQSCSPVPHPSSTMAAAPFKFLQQHHLSDGNIPATTAALASSNARPPEFSNAMDHSALDRELGLLTTLAYDGNSRRYYDAFQNLHGLHNSTPHLPSATATSQPVFDDQPLFGSDPNLLRKSRQPEFDTFYDNLFFSPPGNSKRTFNKNTANVTYPPVNPTLRSKAYPHDDETNRVLAQFEGPQPEPVYAQPFKSTPSLQTSSSSAFSSFQHPQNHTDFRDWNSDSTATLASPVSSSCASFPFPAPGQESYYSSTNVQGFCTLPRNSHSANHGSGASNKTISLAHKEPSYEEITNITPAPGKGTNTNSRPVQMLNHPDISAQHLDRHRNRNFPISENAHRVAPLDSSTNLSTSVATHSSSAISYPTISTSGIEPSHKFDERTVLSRHPEVGKLDKTYTGRIPISDMSLAKIEPVNPECYTGKNQSHQAQSSNHKSAAKPIGAKSVSMKLKGEKLPGSVSDRALKFEQKASNQGETKKKTGIPTFSFVRLRSKTSKTEQQESKPKDKSKAKREVRNLDSSFEKDEKPRATDSANGNDSGRDSFSYIPRHVHNLVGDRKNNVYELTPFPVTSHSTSSSMLAATSSVATAVTTATSSIPLLTFPSSKSSSPPRQRMSNPEDAVSKEAAFLAVTGSDVISVAAPARGQQTSSMHETGTGSVDVDSNFSDFLLASGSSHNYHLFSRRKKPLPTSGKGMG
ncbi:hypothetical protein ElyMa_004551900 [Elysia marginata]|uniref:Uncharacterized protein n=1 Tax=Elysia marginata TaxID=1093978 RepID=A0AAV4HT16_9GAST|nr:hypothetical protein ElyMa_004551900 [Elysia marginata]